jgi:chemotaxis protein MotB
MRKTVLRISLLGLLAVAGCGIPKTQHDAALADLAAKNKAECDTQLAARQKEIDELKTKLAEAEGKMGAQDEATKAELEELRRQKAASEARLKLLEEFLSKFKSMIESGKLDITVRRGQIVLMLGTDILFDTGKTEIKPDGVKALTEIADVLKTVGNRRFQIAGHTDNVPIKTPEFPSNWELSTARGVAVVKLLLQKGVRPDALSAGGYAEFDPAQSNASDQGKAKNRRIEIVLVPNIEELVKMPEVGTKIKDPSKEPPKPPPPADPPKPKDPPAKPKDPPAKPKDPPKPPPPPKK